MKIKTSQTISLDLSILLLIVSYFFISVGQIQRIQLSYHAAFYAHDLFITLFVFATSLIHSKTIFGFLKKQWFENPVWKWLAIFLGWSLFSLIFNQLLFGFNIFPWLYWLRLFVYLSAGILMYKLKHEGSQRHQWLKLVFIISSIIFLSIGFLQYLLIPDLRFLGSQGWDVHFFRLAGSLLDPNFLGMILVNSLFVWIFAIASNNNWRMGVGVLFILALLLTYSRSSYGAFLLMSVFCLFLSKTKPSAAKVKKPLLILTALFIMLIPFLPRPGGLGVQLSRTETMVSRTKVNQEALANISFDDLIMGKGLFVSTVNLEVSDQIIHANFPDNLFVFLLTGTGIIGVALFLYFLFLLFKNLYHNNSLHFLLILGILAHSMFNLTLTEPINLLMLILALQI
jgi:hypothetical protein